MINIVVTVLSVAPDTNKIRARVQKFSQFVNPRVRVEVRGISFLHALDVKIFGDGGRLD